ncbi:MAG: RluA family pseudouridine synthase [Bacteroidales bacterium]|nr:RluA family pseudouridine synthase [Bacteroidales bacterium]
MGRHDNRKEAMEIVFEDDWLIVVNKPSGLLSVATNKGGSKGPEVTAHSLLMDYMAEQQGRRGGRGRGRDMAGNNSQNLPRIFIVHRLDRDTSGLVVFAKDEETKHALQDNWSEVVQERKYVAVLEGHIDSEDGWIESWLYEHPKSLKVHAFELREGDTPERPPRKEWQYASTHCKTIGHLTINEEQYTKVEFELETGRKNQIRVHSQWIGHPIAGDKKYGAATNPFGRLALHAQTLSFIHPWTGQTVRFTSLLPRLFNRR